MLLARKVFRVELLHDVVGLTSHEAPYFEESYCAQKGCLCRTVLIQLSPEGRENANGQEIGTAIPL